MHGDGKKQPGPIVDQQNAALAALTMLLGIVVDIHPRREEVLAAFEQSLRMLDQDAQSQPIARRAQQYGREMVARMQPRRTGPPIP